MDTTAKAGNNRLLATLRPETLRRMLPDRFQTHLGQTIQEGNVTPTHVLFPDQGTMLSVVRADESGGTVEVAVIGGNGASSLQSALASLPTRSEIIVQTIGPVTRIEADRVREVFGTEESFRNAVLAYSNIYLEQVSQNALCNRLHGLEARLAKWLLLSSGLTGSDVLTLTHDFLSHMLGVRRPGVTVAVNALALDGLIGHSRAAIVIRDRAGLESRACECERVLRGSDHLGGRDG